MLSWLQGMTDLALLKHRPTRLGVSPGDSGIHTEKSTHQKKSPWLRAHVHILFDNDQNRCASISVARPHEGHRHPSAKNEWVFIARVCGRRRPRDGCPAHADERPLPIDRHWRKAVLWRARRCAMVGLRKIHLADRRRRN